MHYIFFYELFKQCLLVGSSFVSIWKSISSLILQTRIWSVLYLGIKALEVSSFWSSKISYLYLIMWFLCSWVNQLSWPYWQTDLKISWKGILQQMYQMQIDIDRVPIFQDTFYLTIFFTSFSSSSFVSLGGCIKDQSYSNIFSNFSGLSGLYVPNTDSSNTQGSRSCTIIFLINLFRFSSWNSYF